VSYASVESTRRNAPIECYAFARDDQAWYYTTHDVDVTRNGETYRAALMERDAFRQSEEGEQISVTLRIANETPLAEEIRAVGLPSTRGVMMMRLIATHAGSSDIIVPFLGRVTGYQMLATNVSLTVESEQALFKQKILRVIGGVQCNHDLYGPGCGVNMEDHRYDDQRRRGRRRARGRDPLGRPRPLLHRAERGQRAHTPDARAGIARRGVGSGV
jgi:hypothetical protein